MSWLETAPMDQRLQFLIDYASGLYGVTELCIRYGVSRSVGNALIARYRIEGFAAAAYQSRAPLSCPHRTSDDIVEELLEERRSHPTWGPKKIKAVLELRNKRRHYPAASTIGDLFDRHGLTNKRPARRQPSSAPSERPKGLLIASANDEWCCDFKGQFRMGNGSYCFPLTITDSFSRMLLACRAQSAPNLEQTKRNFRRVFERYGLPRSIRNDNGEPFAGQGPLGLSSLGVWFVKLEIERVRTRPGCPQDNAAHERMHKTLKAETTRPPKYSMRPQQKCFDEFRGEFNYERPHEAHAQLPPITQYSESLRQMPSRLIEPEYAGHCEVRKVSPNGTISFKGRPLFLSEALAGEIVALEEIDDALWSIHFYGLLLRRFDELTWTVS